MLCYARRKWPLLVPEASATSEAQSLQFLAHLSRRLKLALSVVCRCRRRRRWCRCRRKLFTFSSSSPEPVVQFQPNLAQSILR